MGGGRGWRALWLLMGATVAAGMVCAGAYGATSGDRLGGRAAAQVAALQKVKRSLSVAERKLDSRLVLALRQRTSVGLLAAVPKLRTGVGVSSSGRTEVDVSVRAINDALLARLRSAGADVRYASKATGVIRAALPLASLPRVAAWRDVVRVDVAVGAITERRLGRPVVVRESNRQKLARVRRALARALRAPAAPPQGAVVSEGDKAHAADRARALTGVLGAGVKVCVLSDGVDSLAAEQAAGELPSVDVAPGQAGAGDEGTAMLEIVHDLAPHAALGFATAFISEGSFADNIRALRLRHGCDVLIDDVLYFDEDPFQDGPVAQAVNAVTADGALYFSSAGNEGNMLDHTSGNYEADFRSGGRLRKVVGVLHDFDPGPGVQLFDPLSQLSLFVPVTLFWADPLGHAADDYDLYAFDADGNVLAASQNVQDGNDNPYEIVIAALGTRLGVVKYAGATRYLQLSALGGRFSPAAGLAAYATPGVMRGHAAAADAFAVAAAPAKEPLPFSLEPGDPPNPHGPFPGPFAPTQAPERFTSDGPRRVFFSADGTPITPGNFTHTGGAVRQKPDITAADGISTGLVDFTPFFGTSAAAPHAAAIAALALSGNPGATNADVRQAFDATALDLAPAGVDPRSGHGILRADRVLSYTGATPQPLATVGSVSVTPVTGDGDPYLEPGERGRVMLRVDNRGDAPASGVSVTLTSADPHASVSPHALAYGTIAPSASASNGFDLTLGRDYELGKPAPVALVITFAGGLSPTRTTITIRTGQPAATATTFRSTGPPVSIPDASQLGASVPIQVSGMAWAAKLTFSIDGNHCTTDAGATTVGLDHTYVSDLIGTLTGPHGQTAVLFDRTGEDGNNMCQVVFSDAGSRSIDTATTEDAPFTGTWRPQEPLAPLRSAPVTGEWRFKVADLAPLDTGHIGAVSLHITGYTSH